MSIYKMKMVKRCLGILLLIAFTMSTISLSVFASRSFTPQLDDVPSTEANPIAADDNRSGNEDTDTGDVNPNNQDTPIEDEPSGADDNPAIEDVVNIVKREQVDPAIFSTEGIDPDAVENQTVYRVEVSVKYDEKSMTIIYFRTNNSVLQFQLLDESGNRLSYVSKANGMLRVLIPSIMKGTSGQSDVVVIVDLPMQASYTQGIDDTSYYFVETLDDAPGGESLEPNFDDIEDETETAPTSTSELPSENNSENDMGPENADENSLLSAEISDKSGIHLILARVFDNDGNKDVSVTEISGIGFAIFVVVSLLLSFALITCAVILICRKRR